jgi:hypothetical protein
MTKRVVLDWSRLLGFDQIARPAGELEPQLTDPRMTKLGPKVGTKPCTVRRDDGVQEQVRTRLGAKVGVKPRDRFAG